MARKSNQEQPAKSKIQKAKKVSLTNAEKAKMIEIANSLGEQDTFNEDPLRVLVEDGEIEHAV